MNWRVGVVSETSEAATEAGGASVKIWNFLIIYLSTYVKIFSVYNIDENFQLPCSYVILNGLAKIFY